MENLKDEKNEVKKFDLPTLSGSSFNVTGLSDSEIRLLSKKDKFFGAGIILYCYDPNDKKVYFLFHRTFVGKKKGYLIDCGGAVEKSEMGMELWTAIREFSEETEGYFFKDFRILKNKVERIEASTRFLRSLMDKNSFQDLIFTALTTTVLGETFHYKTFFFPLETKIDLKELNDYFEENKDFCSKKRLFEWVSFDQLFNSTKENSNSYVLIERISHIPNVDAIFRNLSEKLILKYSNIYY